MTPAWPGGRSDGGPLPTACRGRRCLVVLRLPGARKQHLDAPAHLTLAAETGECGETYIPLRRMAASGAIGTGIVFIPHETRSLAIDTFAEATGAPVLDLVPLPASVAAILIGGTRLAALRARLDGTGRGLLKRLRTTLAHAAPELAAAGDPRLYRAWVRLFDQWMAQDRDRLLDRNKKGADAAAVSIAALVFAANSSGGMAGAETLAALRRQWLPPATIAVVRNAAEAQAAIANDSADYWLVLQAGEIVPPHATALFAVHLVRAGLPDVALGDEDRVAADGQRIDPVFKPQPSLPLLAVGHRNHRRLADPLGPRRHVPSGARPRQRGSFSPRHVARTLPPWA